MGVFRVVGGVVVVGVGAGAGAGGGSECEAEDQQELGGGGPGEFAEQGFGQPAEEAFGETGVGDFDGVGPFESYMARLGRAGEVKVELDLDHVGVLGGEVVEGGVELFGGQEIVALVGDTSEVVGIEFDLGADEFGVDEVRFACGSEAVLAVGEQRVEVKGGGLFRHGKLLF